MSSLKMSNELGNKKMRVIFSGGGTGGHIYPILALIKRMQERDLIDDVLFVGSKRGQETKLVPKAGIKFKSLNVQGFSKKNLTSNFTTLKLFVNATKDAKKIIEEFKPDIVVGTGGYVSAAIVYQAAKMKIPTLIHEQNSVVGVANKFLAHFVDRITYVFDDAADQFSEKKKLVKTGNPRSQEIFENKNRTSLSKFDLKENVDTAMIFGGSGGAKKINDIAVESIDELNKRPYQILFVTGQNYYNDVKTALAHHQINENIKIVPYVSDMPSLLPNIGTVVSRSGATTLAEITALGVPAILIPSPNVTHNHQEKNANDLAQKGAATVLYENDLNVNNFVCSIDHILLDHDSAEKMSLASKKLAVTDASDQIIQVMENIIK